MILLIPLVLTEILILVPGIEILQIVPKKGAEAGGMKTGVTVLFRQISTEYIPVVEMTPGQISTGIN